MTSFSHSFIFSNILAKKIKDDPSNNFRLDRGRPTFTLEIICCSYLGDSELLRDRLTVTAVYSLNPLIDSLFVRTRYARAYRRHSTQSFIAARQKRTPRRR